MKKIVLVLVVLVSALMARSQSVKVFPKVNDQLGGLQSYTYGSSANGYIVFGGRLDGLHRRQPFAAFDIAGHNLNIAFIDPITGNVVYHNTSSLPDEVEEQMHLNAEKKGKIEFVYENKSNRLGGTYLLTIQVGNHIVTHKVIFEGMI